MCVTYFDNIFKIIDDIKEHKEKVVRSQMFTISCYQFLGQAASIADMCITPDEFLQRVGDFGQYCPVSLADKNELIDCSTNVTLKYAAEFRGMYPTPWL